MLALTSTSAVYSNAHKSIRVINLVVARGQYTALLLTRQTAIELGGISTVHRWCVDLQIQCRVAYPDSGSYAPIL